VRFPFEIEEVDMNLRTLLISGTIGATALLLAGTAGAASGSFGSIQNSARSVPNGITAVRHAGPMMGMHMHSPGIAGPRISHGPVLHAYSAPHIGHMHHHHRRFFFVGVPYYNYDYAYDPDCYWSRRYQRWVCPSY
jgi:hypothetical protein